ncbi:MAG: hypothetical protein JO070_02665 [Verrucomicrobia bacterium]|nr:hypothetical protein [Verrucomicrobiota bacterium]
MNLLSPELVKRAFQIKYGFAHDLSLDQIYQEFERRYNLALILRQSPGSDHSWTKIIEGVSSLEDPEEVKVERERRRSEIATLATAAGYSPVELDLLSEEYLARLEVRWIHEG